MKKRTHSGGGPKKDSTENKGSVVGNSGKVGGRRG